MARPNRNASWTYNELILHASKTWGALFLSGAILAGCHDAAEDRRDRVFLYIANTYPGRIVIFSIDQQNGAVTPIHDPVPAGDMCNGLVIHPNGRYLYAGTSQGLFAFRIHGDGSLTHLDGSPYRPYHAQTPALHPSGRFLYVASLGSSQLYRVDETTGKLEEDRSAQTRGGALKIQAIDPSGRFFYSGMDQSWTLVRGTIDPNTGHLGGENDLVNLRGLPTDIAVHPSGKMYVVSSDTYSRVGAYRIQSDGSLRSADEPYAAEAMAMRAAMDPKGEFLYVSNAGTNNLSGYRIEKYFGRLERVPGSPFPVGFPPSALEIDPAGNFLYVGGAESQRMRGFQINRASGELIALPEISVPVATNTQGVKSWLADIVFTPQAGPEPVVASLEPAKPATPAVGATQLSSADPIARLHDPDFRVRGRAVWEVFSLAATQPEAVQALAAALSDEQDWIAATAAAALGKIGPKAAPAVPTLTRALSDPRVSVRIAAAQALKGIGASSDEVRAALTRMSTLGDDKERAAAIATLAALDPSGEIDLLLQRLRSGSYQEKKAAVDALLANPAIATGRTHEMGEILFQVDTRFSRSLIEVLKRIGPPAGEAIPYLYGMLQDPYLVQDAAAAIQAIRNVPPAITSQ